MLYLLIFCCSFYLFQLKSIHKIVREWVSEIMKEKNKNEYNAEMTINEYLSFFKSK